MQQVRSPAEVIEILGGVAPVADLTGRSYDATWNWKTWKHFPPDTYLVLTDALNKRGYEAPASLWRMVEPQ